MLTGDGGDGKASEHRGTIDGPGSESGSARQQRQSAAQRRAQLRPLQRALEKTERALEQQQRELKLLQQQLADQTLYENGNSTRLAELVRTEGSLKSTIAALEDSWMEQQEALEQAGG